MRNVYSVQLLLHHLIYETVDTCDSMLCILYTVIYTVETFMYSAILMVS